MGDRAAEGGLFRRDRIDVDELAVLGDLGERVDAGLIDQYPFRQADLGSDQRLEV